MPVLSNGNTLTLSPSPDSDPDSAFSFSISESDGDIVAEGTALPNYLFGWVTLADIDVIDGYFIVTGLTHDGKYQISTSLEARVFDNEGNYLGGILGSAAFGSVSDVTFDATSPANMVLSWTGATEYFAGQNTQYGLHQLILDDSAYQPFVFDNHLPSLTNASFIVTQGQTLHAEIKGSDPDYDLLNYIIVDWPDHGDLTQETQFSPDYYPFEGGEFITPHYHKDFLYGNFFTYTPETGYMGADSFTVYATDGQGNSQTVTYTISVNPQPVVTNFVTLTSDDDTASYHTRDREVMVQGLGGNDSIMGSRFNDSLNGGAGNDALRGGDGKDTITGGTGVDRVQGGSGNDTFIFKAGDLATSGVDHIIDFRGAGTSGTGEQDIIHLKGFGAGTTLVFDHFGANASQQYYRVVDTSTPAHNGLILVQMADGTNLLGASDYAFYV